MYLDNNIRHVLPNVCSLPALCLYNALFISGIQERPLESTCLINSLELLGMYLDNNIRHVLPNVCSLLALRCCLERSLYQRL
jgi:hypothetical protein